jgi:hypothetical protein
LLVGKSACFPTIESTHVRSALRDRAIASTDTITSWPACFARITTSTSRSAPVL